MNVPYDKILNDFPERQDVLLELDRISSTCSRYNESFILWITRKSLRPGFDPKNVRITDIVKTSRAAELATAVIYFDDAGNHYILKCKYEDVRKVLLSIANRYSQFQGEACPFL